MLTDKNQFFERSAFVQLLSCFPGASSLPPPAIWKPVCLWTGKQLFSALLSSAAAPSASAHSSAVIDLETRNKSFAGVVGALACMDPLDNFVVVRQSELVCGRVDKKIVGTGSKENLVHLLLTRRGPKVLSFV